MRARAALGRQQDDASGCSGAMPSARPSTGSPTMPARPPARAAAGRGRREPAGTPGASARTVAGAAGRAGRPAGRDSAGAFGFELAYAAASEAYHLRKVFTKLGTTSRTELIRDGLPGPAAMASTGVRGPQHEG